MGSNDEALETQTDIHKNTPTHIHTYTYQQTRIYRHHTPNIEKRRDKKGIITYYTPLHDSKN